LTTEGAPDCAVDDGEVVIVEDHELAQDFDHRLYLTKNDNMKIIGIQFREKLFKNNELARTARKRVAVSDGALGNIADEVTVAAAPTKVLERAIEMIAAAPAARIEARSQCGLVHRLVEGQLIGSHTTVDNNFFPCIVTAG
jgi:hypothetical protein